MSENKSYESRVRYFVEPQIQKTAQTCWLTAVDMLLEGFRFGHPKGEVLRFLSYENPLENPSFREKILAANLPLPVKDLPKFLEASGFESRATPVNPYLIQEMLRNYGPLLYPTKWHARVITGIDLIDEQNAVIEYVDPGDGERHREDLNTFFLTKEDISLGYQGEPLLMFLSPQVYGGGETERLDVGDEQVPAPVAQPISASAPSGFDAEAGYFPLDTGAEQTLVPIKVDEDAGYFPLDAGAEQSPAPVDVEQEAIEAGIEATQELAGRGVWGDFTPDTGGEQTPALSEFNAEAGYFAADTGGEQTPAPSGGGQDTGYFTSETDFEQSFQPPAWSGQDVGDFTPDTGFEQSFQPPAWSGQDVGDFTPDTGGEQSIPPPDWST